MSSTFPTLQKKKKIHVTSGTYDPSASNKKNKKKYYTQNIRHNKKI